MRQRKVRGVAKSTFHQGNPCRWACSGSACRLLLTKLIEERLGGNPRLLPMVGFAAFATMLCGAVTQFTVGRLIDRTALRRVFLSISALLVPALLAVTWAQGWLVLPSRR
jgi:MFS family permease